MLLQAPFYLPSLIISMTFVTFPDRVGARRSGPPVFAHTSETQDLNCARFLEQTILKSDGVNRNEDLSEYIQNRVLYPDTEDWNSFKMDCESIFTRTYFQLNDLYPEEREFPLAFARTVYKDYRLIEMELASTYAPQNHYCYALDANSSPLFHARMKSMANCFSNVYLTTTEYIMDSQGHNVSRSQFECFKQLSNPEYKWNYLITMQNHDISLRTNQELIQVFQWFNGTNDMLMMKVPPELINPNFDWSFKALKLFKNDIRNSQIYKGFDPILTLSKSYSTASLSRKAVDFMVNELQLETFMKAMEWREHGTNELFLGSLNNADAIGLPGGFTHHCLKDEVPSYFVSRYSIFRGQFCATDFWRNDMCIFGMEHLAEFQYSPYLFANKFLPNMDFGAIACWHEYIFNRTHLERNILRLDPKQYTNVPHVRFNQQRDAEGDAFNPSRFDCNSSNPSVQTAFNLLVSALVLANLFRIC